MLKKNLILVFVFTFVSLLALDLLIGAVVTKFSFIPSQSSISKYFSYGVSTSRKLNVLVGNSDEDAFSISKAGWNTQLPDRIPSTSTECEKKVTIYGMSFSARIARALHKLDPCYSPRSVVGPSSPLSHSYYSFKTLNDQDDSSVAVLAILASSLPKIQSVSHGSVAFEFPGAHLYPRYFLENGALSYKDTPVKNLRDYREMLNSQDLTQAFKTYLSENDAYFAPFIFSYEWADYSVFLRLLRRAYAQNYIRSVTANVFDGNRFINSQEFIDVSKALVADFADSAKQSSKLPVIILLNDLNYAETLDEVFGSFLKEKGIAYLSSSEFIDSRNVKNFLGDGHYVPKNDALLAQGLKSKIEGLLNK